jgi:alpha-beta hydrolase superfamily lysophospholipase
MPRSLPVRESSQSILFSFFLTIISRGLMACDSVLRVTRGLRRPVHAEDFFFASGDRKLAASFVGAADSAPVVLICHGIGETVAHWSAVQAFLQDQGVSSMVFNYSGYGASSGPIRAEHCDQDLVSAYAELRRRVGRERPLFVLGFSLGSGIAGSGVRSLNPPPAGLFLCEAFTCFREAAQAAGVPRWMGTLVPNLWDTVAAMNTLRLPVCVVHSDGDRLFPVEMAWRIANACGERGELVVVSGLTHDEPYRRPTESYWGPIVERVLQGGLTRL